MDAKSTDIKPLLKNVYSDKGKKKKGFDKITKLIKC